MMDGDDLSQKQNRIALVRISSKLAFRHHFSWFSPYWITFCTNKCHFILPKLRVEKVKVPLFFLVGWLINEKTGCPKKVCPNLWLSTVHVKGCRIRNSLQKNPIYLYLVKEHYLIDGLIYQRTIINIMPAYMYVRFFCTVSLAPSPSIKITGFIFRQGITSQHLFCSEQ